MIEALRQHLDRFASLRVAGPSDYNWGAVHQGGVHALHVVVTGLVHGNEVGSLPAINSVLSDLRRGTATYGGTVTFALGNPEAGLKDKRFLDQDLNRMFGRLDGPSHEERRARMLARILRTADVHLDLHQTILDTREPFTIFPWHAGCWKWARIIRAADACVTRPANQGFALGGLICADEFVRDLGKPGFTLELGRMGFSEDAERRANAAIRHLLAAADRIGAGLSTLEQEADAAPELTYWETAHREPFATPAHQLRSGLTNFDSVTAGEVLSAPGAPEILAPMAGRVLFPKYPRRDADGLAEEPLPTEIVRVITEVEGHPDQVW